MDLAGDAIFLDERGVSQGGEMRAWIIARHVPWLRERGQTPRFSFFLVFLLRGGWDGTTHVFGCQP